MYPWSLRPTWIPYDGGGTFDLLPSGGTGVYWAIGIELGSTLLH